MKSELRTIVEKVVNDFIKEQTQLSESQEYLHSGVVHVSEGLTLQEGLIKTYPIENVVQILKKRYSFQDTQITVDGQDRIALILPSIDKINSMFWDDLTRTMNTCGYFQEHEIWPLDGGLTYVTFEAKYTKDISGEVRNKYKYLFHVTNKHNLAHIQKQGIKPYAKEKGIAMYPSRGYCMIGTEPSHDQERALANIKGSHKEDERVKIVIDVSMVLNQVKFYTDPMTPKAIFSYETIPAKAIKSITKYND